MIIAVNDDSIRINEPYDLARLYVATRGTARDAAAYLVASGLAASAEEDDAQGPVHVWVDIAQLRARALAASGDRDEHWLSAWDSMIGFAASSGWVRDGSHVRAHVRSER